MNLKENIRTALLLALGFILHQITPAIFLGMKFDFLLIFIFISVFINPKKNNIILTSLLGGLISAMTTSFPGGQLPNIIDKLVLGLFLFVIMRIFQNKLNTFKLAFIGFFGTIISGSVFLLSALIILSADLNVFSMVKVVVIPAAIINMIGTVFVYKIVAKSMKLSKISSISNN